MINEFEFNAVDNFLNELARTLNPWIRTKLFNIFMNTPHIFNYYYRTYFLILGLGILQHLHDNTFGIYWHIWLKYLVKDWLTSKASLVKSAQKPCVKSTNNRFIIPRFLIGFYLGLSSKMHKNVQLSTKNPHDLHVGFAMGFCPKF